MTPAVVAIVGGLALVAALVRARRRAGVRRHREAIEASLGLTVDLVAVVLGSGGTIRQAIEAVARTGPAPTRSIFATALDRSQGAPLADALADASSELGPPFHPLIGALVNAEIDGAPVATVLARLTDDVEHRDRWRAEAATGRLSVRLLPPLVMCLLPAVVVGAVVPLVVVALRELRW